MQETNVDAQLQDLAPIEGVVVDDERNSTGVASAPFSRQTEVDLQSNPSFWGLVITTYGVIVCDNINIRCDGEKLL